MAGRILRALALALGVLCIFAGCGKTGAGPAQESATTAGPVEATTMLPVEATAFSR